MSVDIHNAEGYVDPTPYQALSGIERDEQKAFRSFRPVVYICSPYAGDMERNTEAARKYSRFAVDQGYIPIAPHLLFPQFLHEDDPDERELGHFFGSAVMSKCAEVWVFGNKITDGMAADIRRARWRNSILRFFTEELEEKEDA